MDKTIDKGKIYHHSDDFFTLDGSVRMKLSSEAAMAVCKDAINHNQIIIRIEGGIWHNQGFEARVDCIWDSRNGISTLPEIEDSNLNAFYFIKEESAMHDTFIITTKDF